MAKEDISIVSSRGSYTPTDLSRRTGHTSVSVPEDGRAITIHTNHRKQGDDNSSHLTAPSHTSLLIEYFEGGKRSEATRRPSVRVKLTPSSRNRSSQVKSSSRDATEVGARTETSEKAQRPSYTNRQSLPLPKAGDRLTLGEDRVEGRSRSFSGDFSSNLSLEDDNDSRAPWDIEIYHSEKTQSTHQDSGRYQEPEVTVKTKKGRTSSKSYGNDLLSPKVAKKSRSRSTSREYEKDYKRKSERRRSYSVSPERNRVSRGIKEKMEKLGAEPKSSKSKSKGEKGDDGGKSSRRKRSRSGSRDRKADKSEKAVSKLSDNPQYDPALLEAVEDTIKRLILPQLQDLKMNQNKSKFDQTIAALASKTTAQAVLKATDDPKGLKSASMPDVKQPTVVLQPDFDKGKGQGFVVAGSREQSPAKGKDSKENKDNQSVQSDNSYSRAPGLGPTLTATGGSIHSAHSDKGEGVLLEPMPEVLPEDRVNMPPMPLDDHETDYAETRASILSDHEDLPPYPTEGRGKEMPGDPRLRSPSLSSLEESIGGRKIIREPESVVAPSTLYPEDHDDHDRPGSSSSIDSGSRVSLRSIQHVHVTQAKPIVVQSPSQMSIPSVSDTPSTKIARQRRKGKARDDAIGEEGEDDDKEYPHSDLLNSEVAPPAKNAADWYSSDNQQQHQQQQRELAQQQAQQHKQQQQQQHHHHHHQQQQDPNFQRASINDRQLQMSAKDGKSFENMLSSEQVRPGQDVFGVSAFNPSIVSTPFAIESHQASILDGMSNLSFQTLPPALCGNTAVPDFNNPMPDINGMLPDYDEVTNPSILDGATGHRDRDWDDLGPSGGHHDDDDHHHHHHHQASGQVKDEGYASPGFTSPGPTVMPMGGIDDVLEGDDYSSQYRVNKQPQHNRVGSGGSHGMPSPIYDSSTGRGIDRIQSRDIIALMDHLTVRDAQRNARDTEILITLVRAAAEMRNSFEDIKKQLENTSHDIVAAVDINTERSVQKVLVGPRPQPISAPRPRRSLASEANNDHEEAAKRKSMFKRALKGLSMRSATDLTRIEQMLERLLDEVEGLKGGNEFYQQSILGTIENLKNTPPHTALNGLDAPSSSTANSGYYTGTGPSASGPSNAPSRQASGFKMHEEMRAHTKISPIEESTSVTPMPPQQNRSLDQTPPKFNPPPAVNTNNLNTPDKKEKPKRESNSSSIFPKISRWSETTTSSGVRGFLRKNKAGKESEASMSNSEFDFWAESGQAGQNTENFGDSPKSPEGPQSPLPPSSRGTDMMPVNQATIRSSLEVKHPQPKPVYRHQLEQQAQNFITMQEPSFNASSPSLVRFAGQTDANGNLMSPMSDTYTQSITDSNLAPQRPPKIPEEYEGTPSPRPLKERKSKERNKDRSERRQKDRDEKDKEQRRRERQERRERRREKENNSERSHRSSKSKLKDEDKYLESADLNDQSPSTTTRSVSNVSRIKGPRPQSSHSYRGVDKDEGKEYKTDLETSGTVKRHRDRSSHLKSGE